MHNHAAVAHDVDHGAVHLASLDGAEHEGVDAGETGGGEAGGFGARGGPEGRARLCGGVVAGDASECESGEAAASQQSWHGQNVWRGLDDGSHAGESGEEAEGAPPGGWYPVHRMTPYVLSMRPFSLIAIAPIVAQLFVQLFVQLFAASPLVAQARELHWPTVSVEAHLDAEGRLRVRERQEIRFVGDWNGGERRLDVPFQQQLTLLGLSRLDSITGSAVPLIEGDLDVVDGFDWSDDGSVLRWRSRAPNDAPFTGQLITYLLELEYENILVTTATGFRLDHDFAFADRAGTIDRFELALTFDDVWGVPEGQPTAYELAPLPPGRGYVVTVPLTYRGTGRPAGVFRGATPLLRQSLALTLVFGVGVMLIALVRRERALGRFAPTASLEDVTPQFIKEHVLAHPPEVIGAMWDDRTAAPEVAATLARLVQEGKMTSRVEHKTVLFKSREVLHLQLTVPRSALVPHEAALVAALFSSGSSETSTDDVRARYKSTGFDPASLIKPVLEAAATQFAPKFGKAERPTPRRTVGFFFAALAATVIALALRIADVVVIAPAVGGMFAAYLFGVVWATSWRARVARLASGAVGFVIPLALILAIAIVAILLNDALRATSIAFLAVTLWAVTFAHSVTMAARTHDTPQRIVVRKRLWMVHDFFARELRKERPKLRDEWFPYVIGFGLGREADRWFRAFGAATSEGIPATSTASAFGGASSTSSAGGSSWSGFGGGGGFSGAGSAGSFAAAVGGMAAAVPSPSSSSSGGGGGGGGSSGGGGGGGW